MSAVPLVRGWCPGAHRPMMSGDGLVVRVRPFRAELTKAQALALCDLARRYGNGVLDLTSRANLQIRGVTEGDHPALLRALDDLGLIDTDPAVETVRNILMPPTWQAGDLTHRLHDALLATLSRLPDLPSKIGFALDTGTGGLLGEGSADIRFELDRRGGLILRADGSPLGRPVTEASAMRALMELAAWFATTGGPSQGRMRRHLAHQPLPGAWANTPPRPAVTPPRPGALAGGTLLAVPFGKIEAADMTGLLEHSSASRLRLTLERRLFLPDVQVSDPPGFLTRPSPLLNVDACPGAPYCPQATVATMELARRLAPFATRRLHVSGCAKGCARARPAAWVLVGRAGHFDLVENGHAWDEPCRIGLSPERIVEEGF
ncbi:cobalamin biosynthesis protein CobG [Sedimentitalea sp. JM2-8]|uniref:Cobalamin biosynthesis protein CobG n=1 Tax=Sedimentitalea xiamensis TaxID=3050037 RepID=A0ABT7FH93_9RHOB|nr:cobalamin biosynthesis protein CobG [Sedimentitalea xiamensis]MDK3074497.1 cobalamin biosynthesis protein CobG [Sedimentitalea xiamensis]